MIRVTICLGILTLIIGLLTGCTGSDYAVYSSQEETSYIEENGLIIEHPRFSFEYPKSFRLVPDDLLHSSANITEVMLTREEESHKIKSHIFIGIFQHEPKYYNGSAAIYLNDILKIENNTPNLTLSIIEASEKLNIVEGKETWVSGISSKYYYCTVANSQGTIEEIILLSYFNKSEFNWVIVLRSYEEKAEEMESVFMHLTESFDIIE